MPVRSIRLLMTCLILLFLFVGCEDNPAEQYTSDLMSAKSKANDAADKATLTAVEATIKNYRAMNGKNPPDLKEISVMMGTELDPGKYDYDSMSGKVKLKSNP
jgi:hypothetical protein